MRDTVYETDTRHETPKPDSEADDCVRANASRYHRTFSQAKAAAIAGDPAALGVPEGGHVVACTVYECAIDTTTPVKTLIGLLNDEIKPVRRLIKYGDLPLPLPAS